MLKNGEPHKKKRQNNKEMVEGKEKGRRNTFQEVKIEEM
jgi:hypothetical protein